MAKNNFSACRQVFMGDLDSSSAVFGKGCEGEGDRPLKFLKEKREKRDRLLKIPLTVHEEALLKKLAQGMSKARYVRLQLFDPSASHSRSAVPQINRELYVQLGQISASISRQTKALDRAIAAVVHNGKSDGENEKLGESILSEYREQIELLDNVLRQVRLALISANED